MKSIRATLIYTLAFALLGCSYTLHNKYPPEHPPSPDLDLSSVQEPVAQIEQPLIETPQPQVQEKPQETIQETPTPNVDKPVHKKVTPGGKRLIIPSMRSIHRYSSGLTAYPTKTARNSKVPWPGSTRYVLPWNRYLSSTGSPRNLCTCVWWRATLTPMRSPAQAPLATGSSFRILQKSMACR